MPWLLKTDYNLLLKFMYEMHNAGNGRVLCVFCNLQSRKWLNTCLLQETAFPPLSGFQFGSVGYLACCEGRKGSNDKVISSRVSLFWNIFAFHQRALTDLDGYSLSVKEREVVRIHLFRISLPWILFKSSPLGLMNFFLEILRPRYSEANQIPS